MHIEKLKSIQECLASAAEAQVYDLENVDAQELGEVIDIIKDIEETIYYCTVTKAMKEGVEEYREPEAMYYGGYRREHPSWREKGMGDWYDERRYYDGKGTQHTSSNSSGHMSDGTGNSNSYYTEREYPHAFEDEREGKSYRSRRMYIESKESKQYKSVQMRELEKYTQELTQDILDMIQDATSDERQYLSKKMVALANKITQLNNGQS